MAGSRRLGDRRQLGDNILSVLWLSMLSGPVRMLTCEMVVWGQTVRSVGPFAFPKARCIVAFFCKADVLFTSIEG